MAADITALIMDDHEWFRRQFAALDDAQTAEELAAIWEPLATKLDVHADAEEAIFYPRLLRKGDDDAEEETEDAVGDHNKIREAVADARACTVGGHEWYEAVGRARKENSEHLAEEEDEGLPNFRKHADAALRAQLAGEWLDFYAAHRDGQGVTGDDVDPEQYIEDLSG